MEERILELKELYDNEISKELFFKLILHVADGRENPAQAYANNLTIPEWKNLFSRPFVVIDVSDEQLSLFFNYMIKYSMDFFGRNQDKYFVLKTFINDLRTEENFEFESILLTAFELI